MIDVSVEERFWARVNKQGDGGCWLWTGPLLSTGYAAIKINKVSIKVHRVAYEFLVGPIPEGLTLDHLCRVRHCVWPKHLEPVTGKENTLRGAGFAAVNARKSHCPQGHEYIPENIYRRPDGRRECYICRRLYQQRKRARLSQTKAAIAAVRDE